MPINGTHRFADYLTNEQKAAYASGDEKAMAAADTLALQDALKASQEDAPGSSRAALRRATGVPATLLDPRKAQKDLAKSAEADLNRRGFQLVKIHGCAPNCLLVALLQHASGEYAEQLSSSFSTKVAQCRDALVQESRKRCDSGERKTVIGTNERLYAEDPLMPWLARKILGDDVRVDFYCADADGKAVKFHSVGEGTHSVKNVFDCGGSFKAIIPGNQGWHTRHADQRA